MISSIGLLAVEIFSSQRGEASIASEYADSNFRCFLFIKLYYVLLFDIAVSSNQSSVCVYFYFLIFLFVFVAVVCE